MSVKIRKLAGVLAVVAFAAIVAVGCGGSDSDGDSSSVKQELVANMGEETEPGQFIVPAMSYLDSVNAKGYTQFAGLYKLVGDEGELEPALADGEPEVSDDGLTYTVKLRDDIEWSDGKPIVAADVVTAIRYTLDAKNGTYFGFFLSPIVGGCEALAGGDKAAIKECPAPQTDGSLEAIGATAVDDQTLEIKLTQQVPWFNQLLAIQSFYPMREDQFKKLGKEYGKSTETAVSGPFKLVSYDAGKSITYEKNDKYFDADEVKLEKLTLEMIKEPATASRDFQRNKLDTGLPGTMYDAAAVDKWKSKDVFYTAPGVSTQYMYMNTTNKELSDPKVRQAIALAVNRKDIVDNITKRGDKPASTVVPPQLPGYDVWGEGSQDFLNTDGTPNVDKAKSLLEEAGWDESETLQVYFSSDSSSAPAIAEQIQSNLDEVGIKVALNPTSGSVFSEPGIGVSPVDAKVDLMLQGWVQDYFDAQNWYQLFITPNIEQGLNAANFSSKEFDKVYDEAIKTVDEDARFDLYKQLEALLTGPDGNMPVAPLYNETWATLVQPEVKGFEIIPAGVIYWENVSLSD